MAKLAWMLLALAASVVATPVKELFLSDASVDTKVDYTGAKVFRFAVATEEHRVELEAITRKNHLSKWTSIKVGRFADILIPAHLQATIVPQLSHIETTVMLDDVQVKIDAEREHNNKNAHVLSAQLQSGAVTFPSAAQIFSDFQPLTTLLSFYDSLPGVTKVVIGKTHLGNTIYGYKFGTGSKGIVYHGGIHAREWIAPAATAYITNELITNKQNAALLKKFTFTVVP
ncbi:hypothetical protein BDK51DRAFT_31844, partial [Blyttiomyces helicus]